MTITRPVTSPTVVPNRLKNRVGNVFVIAYQEPTDALETALSAEGFQHQLLRQSDTAESQTYAAIYRCMLNHQRAWQQAAKATQPSLIVEADFVPVVGMGNLPLPFNPMQSMLGLLGSIPVLLRFIVLAWEAMPKDSLVRRWPIL